MVGARRRRAGCSPRRSRPAPQRAGSGHRGTGPGLSGTVVQAVRAPVVVGDPGVRPPLVGQRREEGPRRVHGPGRRGCGEGAGDCGHQRASRMRRRVPDMGSPDLGEAWWPRRYPDPGPRPGTPARTVPGVAATSRPPSAPAPGSRCTPPRSAGCCPRPSRDRPARLADGDPGAGLRPAWTGRPRRRGGRSGRRRSSTAACRSGPRRARRSPASTAPLRPLGPTAVAPTSTPRSASSTSLTSPLAALAIQPRVDEARSVVPTRTVSPASRACCSVIPTEPTSGSVNVTCGTAWYAAGGPSWPRMSRTAIGGLVHRHVRERALAGDVADRPEPSSPAPASARRSRSTARAGSRPTVSSPRSARFGRRPAATSSLSRVQRSARPTVDA